MLPVARIVVAALIVTVSAGCARRVSLVSHPVGAYVTVGEARAGVAPVDLDLPTIGGRRVSVQRTDYRTLDLRLPLFPPRAIEVRLVREHGGAGSWEPEDVE